MTVPMMIALAIIGVLTGTLIGIYFILFNSSVRENYQARLAVESQGILRSIVEELRISAGVRATSFPDANVIGGAPTWSTNNANLVLIIETPATDVDGNVLHNTSAGTPYMNQIVYFANGGKLYKRYLADTNATGNRYKTSCPLTIASSTCPADALLSEHFKTMSFQFYDQDNALINQTSGDITKARSIELDIDMEQKTFGMSVDYNNKIRMTMRNYQ